jgi:hypothetical protein
LRNEQRKWKRRRRDGKILVPSAECQRPGSDGCKHKPEDQDDCRDLVSELKAPPNETDLSNQVDLTNHLSFASSLMYISVEPSAQILSRAMSAFFHTVKYFETLSRDLQQVDVDHPILDGYTRRFRYPWREITLFKWTIATGASHGRVWEIRLDLNWLQRKWQKGD